METYYKFLDSSNALGFRMEGLIPWIWYIECHEIGIVGMWKSPYLCTQKQ